MTSEVRNAAKIQKMNNGTMGAIRINIFVYLTTSWSIYSTSALSRQYYSFSLVDSHPSISQEETLLFEALSFSQKMMLSTTRQVVRVWRFLILLVSTFLVTSAFSFTLTSPNSVRDSICPSGRLAPSCSRHMSMRQGHNLNLSHHKHQSELTKLTAAIGGGDNESDDSKNSPLLPFALPSLSQILSLWIVGISANRVYQSISLAQNSNVDSSAMTANIALNGVLFLGASFFLFKSIQGIDYTTLEGLDKLSLANQAGEWSMAGIVPTTLTVDDKTYEVATFAGGCFWYVKKVLKVVLYVVV